MYTIWGGDPLFIYLFIYFQDKPSADQDTSFGQRKKLRTVKSAESLAHCLKESPHSTNIDDFSGMLVG